MSKLPSPRLSIISQEDSNTQSIKAFRQSAIDFLKTESLVVSARDQKTSRDFVPFVNERDQLGNLLSKKRKHIQLPVVTKIVSSTTKNSAREMLSFSPDDSQIHDFNFDNFRHQPIITQAGSKSKMKALLKPLEIKGTLQSSMSQCFLTPGRQGPPNEKSPGVGYYHIKESLIFPNSKKALIAKENKMRSLSNNMRQSLNDIDPVKSYEKIHQKNVFVPDFMRSTARSNHYYNKIIQYPGMENGKNIQYNYDDIIANAPNHAKDNPPDVEPRWRRRDFENNNNLPIDTFGMVEKFRQIKKKYNVSKIKQHIQ